MDSDRKKDVSIVNENIQNINAYFDIMPASEIKNLFMRMEEIIEFYGFKKNIIMLYIKNGGIDEEFENVSELEGVTNAILFNLKYKSGRTVVRTRGKGAGNKGGD